MFSEIEMWQYLWENLTDCGQVFLPLTSFWLTLKCQMNAFVTKANGHNRLFSLFVLRSHIDSWRESDLFKLDEGDRMTVLHSR
jgi:hypothetical protein